MMERQGFNQPPEHVERIGEQMRDTTELDNLTDDIRRNLKGEPVTMPWRVGRPLHSAGMDEATGLPLTPLAALDLVATVPPEIAARIDAEFARAALMDNISEGVLDRAEALGVPLVVQETQEEADHCPSGYHTATFEEWCAVDPDDNYMWENYFYVRDSVPKAPEEQP